MLIHQIWYQGIDNIPQKYREYRTKWMQLHPYTTFKLWDSTDILQLIKCEFPSELAWFNSLPKMIQKIDVAKIFIIYAYGGAYIDIDTYPIKSIEPLFNNTHVIVGETGHPIHIKLIIHTLFNIRSGNLINNNVIIAPKHHPFIKDYIIQLRESCMSFQPTFLDWFIPTLTIMNTTGPCHITRAIEKTDHKVIVFGIDELVTDNTTGTNSYIVHTSDKTWVEPQTKLLYHLLIFAKYFVIALICILLYKYFKNT